MPRGPARNRAEKDAAPCTGCGIPKSPEHFEVHSASTGRLRSKCTKCRATSEAARRYGTTVGDIEALAEKQGHSCAICGTHKDALDHASFKHNPLVIDHDHESGTVRGLLCHSCNVLLGHAKDNVAVLAKAITYLSR